MKLCFSNIAWNEEENNKIINLFFKENINYIEYAPKLIFKNKNIKNNAFNIRKFWNKKKILLYSMQSILYEVEDAYIFGNTKQQKIFYLEVKKKIYLAKKLGTKLIVFGSPNSKKTFGRSKMKLDILFEKNIKKIIKICEELKIILCLEANPMIYDTKYLTHTDQALKFVKKINSKYLKLNLDLGTIISNKENYTKIIKKNISHIGHVQISCPKLKNPLFYKKTIKNFINELNKNQYSNVISVEFVRESKSNFNNIVKLIKLIRNA